MKTSKSCLGTATIAMMASALLFVASTSHAADVPLGSNWLLNEGASAAGENTAQLSSNSADGYTYFGGGTTGNQPGLANPDSRTRPKVYNDFASVDLSAVGSSLTMTYDILWLNEGPANESQDFRFGFVSTTAAGGLGSTLGANFDLGNLTGTTYYEFYSDPEVNSTTAASGVTPGEMDFAFSGTNNSGNIPDFANDQARIAQENIDPFDLGIAPIDGDYNNDRIVNAADYTIWRDNDGSSETLDNDPTPGVVDSTDYDLWADKFGEFDTEDIVAFNDATDTHRVSLSLTRITDGYDLEFNWTNLDQIVDGANPTITHTTTITESDSFTNSDPLAAGARAAAITDWDRLGFFINANLNRRPAPDAPWEYQLSNVSIETTGVVSSSAASVPEPATWAVAMIGVLLAAPTRRFQ